MDGLTLGHPCCAHHNCHIPLTTIRDRYCITHRELNNICNIKGCSKRVAEGKMTCDNPVHQEVERIHNLRGQSQFQLQEKLKHTHVSHLNDAVAEDVDPAMLLDEDEEEFELELQVVNKSDSVHGATEGYSDPRGASPSNTNKKKFSAQFGRKHTHNEQILVAPCGMILARETFFGAEAISTCAVRAQIFFPYMVSSILMSLSAGIYQTHISHQ
jgi:hypothetical protein